MHLAARKKDNELTRLFIEAGAEVDAPNGEGQTALHIASLNGDENMIRTLYLARANATLVDNEGEMMNDYLDEKLQYARVLSISRPNSHAFGS